MFAGLHEEGSMEPTAFNRVQAAAAAIRAYRTALRCRASRTVADDVALARFRAYFPTASKIECRGTMRDFLAQERRIRQRVVARPIYKIELVLAN
jgi:hypothetical protein